MILFFLDDVLRNAKGSPIYEVAAILNAVKDSKKVTILSKSNEDADRWLKSVNIGKIDDLVDYSFITATDDKDYWLVEYCRANGKVDLVVTANVELAERLLEVGVNTLLFLHPMYIRPEFRPDGRGRRGWDAIVEEIDKQQELHAEDTRVK